MVTLFDMSESVKHKIEQLSKQIEEHNYNYYVAAKPTISDYDTQFIGSRPNRQKWDVVKPA